MNTKPLDPAACRGAVSSPRWLVQRDSNGCAIWTGMKNRDGYGTLKVNGLHALAHRVALVAHHGFDIEPGLVVDHLCRQPSCVEPLHLEAVTQRENTLRGNTVAARNAGRTMCVRGHLFTEESARPLPGSPGRRVCDACVRMHTSVRDDLIRRAAALEGMTLLAYAQAHGKSGRTARRIIGDAA